MEKLYEIQIYGDKVNIMTWNVVKEGSLTIKYKILQYEHVIRKTELDKIAFSRLYTLDLAGGIKIINKWLDHRIEVYKQCIIGIEETREKLNHEALEPSTYDAPILRGRIDEVKDNG